MQYYTFQFWEAFMSVWWTLASFLCHSQNVCNAQLWCFYSITFQINLACSDDCPASLLDSKRLLGLSASICPKGYGPSKMNKHKSKHAIITNCQSTLKDWPRVLGYLTSSNNLQVRIMLSEHTSFTIAIEFFTIEDICIAVSNSTWKKL